MAETSRTRFKPTNQEVELVFALAGPVGTDFDFVSAVLADTLKDVAYTSEVLKLSRFLREYDLREGLYPIDLSSTAEDVRIRDHQRAGNALRKAVDDNAALAIRAIGAISEAHSTQKNGKPVYKAPRRHAYILDSLKRPEEVHQLRQVYGPGFFLIGVVSPRSVRIERLAENIAKSRQTADIDAWRDAATKLVDVDENEDSPHGQKLSDTFPLADLFVAFGRDREQSRNDVRRQVERFVRLIMGANDTTPTAAESAMFHAFGAAVRSGSLARQVGASLTNRDGEILSVGCNDVPKAGGGIYWEGEHYDHRDIRKERDSSQEHEEEIVQEILTAFEKNGWLSGRGPAVSEAIASLEKTRVVNLLEFMRPLHAEMDALLTAQRNRLSARHATLFCTTFPCHECAKFIVGAGISQVVYIEPYPKSRVAQMYQTEIATEPFVALCNSCEAASTTTNECSSCGKKDLIKLDRGTCAECGSLHRVEFRPFVGVGPRRYLELFGMTSPEGLKFKRKDDRGRRLAWSPAQRSPMFPLSYLEKESVLYDSYAEAFEKLKKKDKP